MIRIFTRIQSSVNSQFALYMGKYELHVPVVIYCARLLLFLGHLRTMRAPENQLWCCIFALVPRSPLLTMVSTF